MCNILGTSFPWFCGQWFANAPIDLVERSYGYGLWRLEGADEGVVSGTLRSRILCADAL